MSEHDEIGEGNLSGRPTRDPWGVRESLHHAWSMLEFKPTDKFFGGGSSTGIGAGNLPGVTSRLG